MALGANNGRVGEHGLFYCCKLIAVKSAQWHSFVKRSKLLSGL
jgi:hypothetical protein